MGRGCLLQLVKAHKFTHLDRLEQGQQLLASQRTHSCSLHASLTPHHLGTSRWLLSLILYQACIMAAPWSRDALRARRQVPTERQCTWGPEGGGVKDGARCREGG